EHHASDAGPGERQRHREALATAEPGQDRAADTGQAQAGPRRRQHQVDREELPRDGDQAERGHRGRHADHAVAEHPARATAVDETADQHDADGADRVIDRHRERDEPGRPPVQTAQRVQIDTEAVETEAPGEGRDDAAGDDDGPAAVEGHGMVIREGAAKRVEGEVCFWPNPRARRAPVKLDVSMLTHDLKTLPDYARKVEAMGTSSFTGALL